MDFGKRIKDLRMSRGWSAEELAERCGVSPATIYRYERGTISSAPVDKIAPIAEALGVSPAVIMGWGDDEKPETPTREDYAALGVAARIAVDTSDTLRHQSPRPSAPTLKSVIKQLEEIDKQNALIMAEDERQLLDAYRHMKTDTQRKILAMMESWRDF